MTKSVTSTLVGIAISEGRLRLDERLAQMLPRYAAEMTPSVARVTLRQLLTHTAGFTDTLNLTGDGTGDFAGLGALHLEASGLRPGRRVSLLRLWRASVVADPGAGDRSIGVGLRPGQTVRSARIVTRPGSEPPFDEAHVPEYQRAGFAWPVDPQGFHTTAFFLKLRPRDMATFGQLFLQNGQWNGRQVVPAAWVHQATTAQAGKAFPDYRQLGPRLRVESDKLRLLLVGGTHHRCHRLLRARVRWAAGRGRARHCTWSSSCPPTPTDVHGAPVVGADEVQHLVDAIVPIIKTHPTR